MYRSDYPDYPDHAIDIPGEGGGEARLVFASGASRLRIRGALQADLLRGAFFGPPPEVSEIGRVVTVSYPSFLRALFEGWSWRHASADISLATRAPWRIALRDGVSELDADLRGVELRSFEVSGGACGVVVALPAPRGIVPIRIRGGASRVCILRPSGTALRARVHGGASSLRIDRLELGAVGGGTAWESEGADVARDRYDLEIGGGACDLMVTDDLEAPIDPGSPYRTAPEPLVV